MKFTAQKLELLQKEIARVLKDIDKGKITKEEAADRISHAKEQMDIILAHLEGRDRQPQK